MSENLSFGAQIDAWTQQTQERILAVFRESTQRVVSLATNGVPVDTGFARASVLVSIEAMPQIDPVAVGEPDQKYNFDGSQISVVIANAKLGQTLYVGWTANYIAYLEYGTSRMLPRAFVRNAAGQWAAIVDSVVSEAKGESAAGFGHLNVLGSTLLPSSN